MLAAENGERLQLLEGARSCSARIVEHPVAALGPAGQTSAVVIAVGAFLRYAMQEGDTYVF